MDTMTVSPQLINPGKKKPDSTAITTVITMEATSSVEL